MQFKKIIWLGLAITPFVSFAQNKPAPTKTPIKPAPAKTTTAAPTSALKSQVDSVSYAIGINIGQNFKNQNLTNLDLNLLQKGMEDVLKGRPMPLDNNQCNAIIQGYMQKQQAKKFEANKSAGEKFLAENKTKSGVITTASGLQYSVIKQGTGAKPLATDKVKVHYHGTTLDGQVFDSSVDRGEPISFVLNQLIPGWIEAVQMMPIGSKWKLFLPYNLAYGETGSGAKIPPFSTLIFDIELLDIEK